MNLVEQIDADVIHGMGVSDLKSLFEDIMLEIGLTGDTLDLEVLAINAGKVWWELGRRGMEFSSQSTAGRELVGVEEDHEEPRGMTVGEFIQGLADGGYPFAEDEEEG
jgi:hypothetical protein